LRSTDSITESTYNEDSMCFIVRPRTRTYQPRVDKTGFEAKTEDKKAQRVLYLQKIEKERQIVLRYIQNGRLDVSKIEDCIPVTLRQTLLRWISAANATSTKSGRTEYGQVYTLIKKEERCILHCEDGDLIMPIYIFEFAG